MSTSEVVKKRGRPKKVVADAIAVVDKPEPPKKSTTLQNSTKASDVAELTASTSPKVTKAATSTKKAGKSTTRSSSKVASTSCKSSSASSKSTTPTSLRQSEPTLEITPANSKILSKVRQLETGSSSSPVAASATPKTPASSPTSTATIRVPESSALPHTTNSSSEQITSLPPRAAHLKSEHSTLDPVLIQASMKTKSSQEPAPPVKPRLPLAELNSSIVSQLSSRAGARPSPEVKQQLPPGYNSVARKVTMTMIALPIAIVTSYVLYQRLILGVDERKHFVRPGLVKVDPGEREQEGET